jgi:hypothetical protein
LIYPLDLFLLLQTILHFFLKFAIFSFEVFGFVCHVVYAVLEVRVFVAGWLGLERGEVSVRLLSGRSEAEHSYCFYLTLVLPQGLYLEVRCPLQL